MLRINEIAVDVGASVETIRNEAAKIIGVNYDDFTEFEISRESIDSRKKNNIKMIYSVDVELESGEEDIAARFPINKVMFKELNEHLSAKCTFDTRCKLSVRKCSCTAFTELNI